MQGKFPDSPISPFVDDLFLIEPDATSSASFVAHEDDVASSLPPPRGLGLGDGDEGKEPSSLYEDLLKSRNILAAQFLSSIRKRSKAAAAAASAAVTAGAVLARAKTTGASAPPPPPAPAAFLTMTTITIQLAMLRQLSQNDANAHLARAVCDALLLMLEPMPIRSLRGMGMGWEQTALSQVCLVMQDLANVLPELRDVVKSLLLSIALHSASLSSILQVLDTITASSSGEFVCAPQTLALVRQMHSGQQSFPLQVHWQGFEKRFPVRHERVARTREAYWAITPNSDSSCLYLSTPEQLVKIGSGDSRMLGSSKAYIPGKVYAKSNQGGFAFMLQGRLFTAQRNLGSALVQITERDCNTLAVLPQRVECNELTCKDLAEREALLTLSGEGEDDDKGGKTIAWASPCGAWIKQGGAYYEVTLRDRADGTLCIGWHGPGFVAADNLRVGGGGDSACWGIDVLTKEVFANGVKTALRNGEEGEGDAWKLAPCQFGDVVGCAIQIAPNNRSASLSFSHNGVWWMNVLEIPCFEKCRPLVSYSSALDANAPLCNFARFKYAAPPHAMGAVSNMMEPEMSTPAPLSILACNGQVLYSATLIDSGAAIAVDSFVLTDTSALVLRETQTFAVVGRRGAGEEASSASMVANGFGHLLLLCEGGKKQYALRDGLLIALEEPRMLTERINAAVFDPQLNLVWAWSVHENSILAFENKALGCVTTSSVSAAPLLAGGERTALHACEMIASSLAHLAQPFASLQVPLNANHTYCAICHHSALVDVAYRDLFIDPFDPATFKSFANLLQFALTQPTASSSSLLESVLTLLQVNLHIANCACRVKNTGSKLELGECADSIKNSLIKLVTAARTTASSSAAAAGAIVRLAERILVDSIPLFWPSALDKIGACNVDNDVLQDRLLVALNFQLLETNNFHSHRAALDDAMVARLLRLQTGPLGQAASTVLIGLLACGFNHLAEVDNLDLHVEESKEEESKEESKLVDPFEDVLDLAMRVIDHCLATKFTTPAAKKVLPLVVVCLDNLVSDAACKTRAMKAVLQSDFCAKLAALARGVVQDLQPDARCTHFTFAKLEVMSSTLDSRMFTADAEGLLKLTVNVPFASQMQISFLSKPQQQLEVKPGEVWTFRASSGGSTAMRYTVDNLPGTSSACPPLVLSREEGFECTHTDRESKFAFRVTANRLVQCKSFDRDWTFHLFDSIKRFITTVVFATTGSNAFALTSKEAVLIRWIQNPLFSGGLRPELVGGVSTPPPIMTPRLTKRAMGGSRSSVLMQSLQEDADRLVNDFLKFSNATATAPASLASSLIWGMRQPMNRVPFDSGKLTQPAVCAVIAALIRTNGLEAEAVAFARAIMEGNNNLVQAPLRLRAIWSAAQLVRAWCDSLIVNGRAQHHFEACGVAEDASAFTELVEEEEKEEETMDFEDEEEREEREYAKLCQLVQSRCELVAQVISPPLFLHQHARPKEDSKARWHFVREFYCPKTSRLLVGDPLACALRGALALSKITGSSSNHLPVKKSSRGLLPMEEEILAQQLPPPLPFSVEIHTTRKASLSSFTPLDATITSPPLRTASLLTRKASLTSWGGPTPRIQSWIVAKDTVIASPPTPSSSITAATSSPLLTRKASIIVESGVRTSGRVEGGLRRTPASADNVDGGGISSAQMEHEQTMSESVLNFVQSATVLRKRDIVAALRSRNERAQARVQGLVIAVSIAQETDFRSRMGRELFELVFHSTIRALSSDLAMEAHFLTDLSGCSAVWRDRVTNMFLALLRLVCQHTTRVAKNQVFLPQTRAIAHVKRLLRGMGLDYVESDYSLLYRSTIFAALSAALAIPALEQTALVLFERLFRRCVIDDQGRGEFGLGGSGGAIIDAQVPAALVVGTIWHQQLMDVLVSTLHSFWSKSYEQEELEFSEEEEEMANEDGRKIRFAKREIFLCHSASQLRSGVIKPVAAEEGEFSLTCTIRRIAAPGGGRIVPGALLDLSRTEDGASEPSLFVQLHVVAEEGEGGNTLLVSVGNALVFQSNAKLHRATKICLTNAGGGGELHLLCSSEEGVSHDTIVLETPMPWRGGSLTIGRSSSSTTGRASSQGLIVCDVCLEQASALPLSPRTTTTGFFGSDVVVDLPKPCLLTPAKSSELLLSSAGAAKTDKEHASVLLCLDLAHLALQRAPSSIAMARLSTPDVQTVLLQILLDVRCPLPVRVSVARVLKRVLGEQTASASKLNQLLLCVSFAMPPTARAMNTLIPDPNETATMAQVIIDLVFFLCEVSEAWAALVAEWIVGRLEALSRCVEPAAPSMLRLPDNAVELQQAFVAISLCGGRMDFVRLGGKAIANKQELVRIVSLAQNALGTSGGGVGGEEGKEVDISKHCEISTLSTEASSLGRFTIQLPHTGEYKLTRIEIHHEAQNSHESIRHARVSFGADAQTATQQQPPQQVQVDPTTNMFELVFDDASVRFVQVDVDTVWGGNATRCRIGGIQVFAKPLGKRSSLDAREFFVCRPVALPASTEDLTSSSRMPAGEGVETANSDASAPLLVFASHALVAQPRRVPRAIIERMVSEHDALHSFELLLRALHENISSALDRRQRRVVVALDLFTRLLKAVCVVLPMLAQFGMFVSTEMALFLCTLAKTQNVKLSQVPALPRFKRGLALESWNLRFTSKPGEDLVRFDPPAMAPDAFSWPHRIAVVDSTSMFGGGGGVHSWTFTLVQDGQVRGDESVLFGLCNMEDGQPAWFAGGEDGSLDVLLPQPRLRLLRAFDGSAIGEAPPSPLLCVRVGDSLRCEWDVGNGTLSMAVNNRPFVTVFKNLGGSSRVWHPCVATYSERGAEVVVALSQVKVTPSHPRRRCMFECETLDLAQVEALAQQALQRVMSQGEEESAGTSPAVPPHTRSLTFRLGGEEEEEADNKEEEEGEDSGEEDEKGKAMQYSSEEEEEAVTGAVPPSLLKRPEVSAFSTFHNPALCGVSEPAASSSTQAAAAAPTAAAATTTMGVVKSSRRDKPLSRLVQSPAMSITERYLALLWELAARLATEGFDSAVKHWPPPPTAARAETYWTEVEETVSALHRVSQTSARLELLHAIETKRLVDFATKRIVRLGQAVNETRRMLKPSPARIKTVKQ